MWGTHPGGQLGLAGGNPGRRYVFGDNQHAGDVRGPGTVWGHQGERTQQRQGPSSMKSLGGNCLFFELLQDHHSVPIHIPDSRWWVSVCYKKVSIS